MVVAGGVHVWLWGGFMLGCRGACMVAGGCAWLQGGVHGCGGHVWLQGACVAVGGMHGCRGGVHGCGGHAWLWGACMVAGGVGACVVVGGVHGGGGGTCVGYDEIRSMSGRTHPTGMHSCFNINSCSRQPILRDTPQFTHRAKITKKLLDLIKSSLI